MCLKGKLWILPIFVLIGFSITFMLNYNLASKNNTSIKDLRDISYPTLELTDKALNDIDKIPSILNNAVSSGELPLLEETKKIAENINLLFDKSKQINESNEEIKSNIKELENEFNKYFINATDVTQKLIIGKEDFNSLNGQLLKMKTDYLKLTESISGIILKLQIKNKSSDLFFYS